MASRSDPLANFSFLSSQVNPKLNPHIVRTTRNWALPLIMRVIGLSRSFERIGFGHGTHAG